MIKYSASSSEEIEQDLEKVILGHMSNCFKLVMRMIDKKGKNESNHITQRLKDDKRREKELNENTVIQVKKKT